jgi:DNA-binding NarL/FixJ family response regulator
MIDPRVADATVTRVAEATDTATVRVLIVDDHTTFTELLTGALDREPDLCSVGFAGSAESGFEQAVALRPDVVIMDYHLPDSDGISAAARILERSPDTRIVLLTGDPTPESLVQAAATGISAFLPKDGSLAALLDALRHAPVGGMMVRPSLVAQLGELRSSTPRDVWAPTLTQRELAVLRLMAEGYDVRANAMTLGISQNTCRGYVKSILAKLGVHSQLEAVVAARKLDLLGLRRDA